MTTSKMSPAVVRSKFPTSVRYARTPNLAQAAINAMLTKRGAALMYFYMGETDGFAPSAHEVYLYTGIDQGNMSRARKELADKGFIEYDREKNTITILWDNIIQMGKVALMLAENPDCSIKDTMQGGTFFHPEKKPTMGTLMKQRDPDAKPIHPAPTHEDYVKAGLKSLEKLTEDEFRLWLQTGCPYSSTLPIDENYVENPMGDTVAYPPEDKEPLKWLDLPEKDMSEVYDIEGDFLIQGFTKEEYEAWHAAGLKWPGEE